MFRHIGNILIIQKNTSLIRVKASADAIKQCRFSCTIASDDRHEISVFYSQAYAIQRRLFIYGTFIKYFSDIGHLQHDVFPPFAAAIFFL